MFFIHLLPDDISTMIRTEWLCLDAATLSALDIAFCNYEQRQWYHSWIGGSTLTSIEVMNVHDRLVAKFSEWMTSRNIVFDSIVVNRSHNWPFTILAKTSPSLFTRLKRLDISNGIVDDSITTLLHHAVQLRMLRISCFRERVVALPLPPLPTLNTFALAKVDLDAAGLEHISRLCPNLESISLDNVSVVVEDWDSVLASTPALPQVSIATLGFTSDGPPDTVGFVLYHCPSVTKLSLASVRVVAIANCTIKNGQSLPNLRSLFATVADGINITISAEQPLKIPWPSLASLSTSDPITAAAAALKIFDEAVVECSCFEVMFGRFKIQMSSPIGQQLQRMSHVTLLKLPSYGKYLQLSDIECGQFLEAQPSSLRNLQAFKLDTDDTLTAGMHAAYAAGKVMHLNKFSSTYTQITDSYATIMTRLMPQLCTLVFNDCVSLTSSALFMLIARLPQLSTLMISFSHVQTIDDRKCFDTAPLAKRVPISMTLSGDVSVSPETVKAIVYWVGKYLRSLEVHEWNVLRWRKDDNAFLAKHRNVTIFQDDERVCLGPKRK